jgi:alkaline phosphatase D
VRASDATWKILISPTPLVGPDRGSKNDNHANKVSPTRARTAKWLQKNAPDNFFIHLRRSSLAISFGASGPPASASSVVGAASNEHAGGSPGEDPTYHKFHRMKGGFISVNLQSNADKSEVTVRHHDVQGEVVHEWKSARSVQ